MVQKRNLVLLAACGHLALAGLFIAIHHVASGAAFGGMSVIWLVNWWERRPAEHRQ